MLSKIEGLSPLGVSSRRGPSVLFYDTFTGANGTLLSAHTPDIGTSWTVNRIIGTASTLQLLSNTLVLNIADPVSAFLAIANTTGVSDCTVSVDALTTQTTAASAKGIILRYVDVNNYWYGAIYTGRLQIYDLVAGVSTLRAQTAAVLTNGVSYAVTFSVASNVFTLSSSAGSCTFTSSTHSGATSQGLRFVHSSGQNPNGFDNFQVVG